MLLPLNLQDALAEAAKEYSTTVLQQAYLRLSEHYRSNRAHIQFSLANEAERIAYITARMPATYAAAKKALTEITLPHASEVNSILDIGSGPGTAAWACCEIFPNISQIQFVEQNIEMIKIGKKLAQQHPKLKTANWLSADIQVPNLSIQKADVVIASYSFNEIAKANHEKFLKHYWSLTDKFMILIDPGTPEGFHSLSQARDFFRHENAEILAPCPHLNACPAQINHDWCHFAVRVQRTSLHKNLKMAEKGYEDEKFSYLILSKIPHPEKNNARITRHPEIHSGHLKLKLCTENGFVDKIYSKKDGQLYKKAKKAEWGDPWDL